jgi:hypothetical protein
MEDSTGGVGRVVDAPADTAGQMLEELGRRCVPADHPQLEVLARDRALQLVMRVVVAQHFHWRPGTHVAL